MWRKTFAVLIIKVYLMNFNIYNRLNNSFRCINRWGRLFYPNSWSLWFLLWYTLVDTWINKNRRSTYFLALSSIYLRLFLEIVRIFFKSIYIILWVLRIFLLFLCILDTFNLIAWGKLNLKFISNRGSLICDKHLRLFLFFNDWWLRHFSFSDNLKLYRLRI